MSFKDKDPILLEEEMTYYSKAADAIVFYMI
jgi:hypothetical protein